MTTEERLWFIKRTEKQIKKENEDMKKAGR